MPTRPLRILVVDDQPDAVSALSMLLSMLGHEVRGAMQGTGVIELIDAFEPELVLLDIGLPDISGYEIVRRLRERGGHSPYVAAITGWGTRADRDRALETGFDEHVIKPLDARTVNRLVASALARPVAAA